MKPVPTIGRVEISTPFSGPLTTITTAVPGVLQVELAPASAVIADHVTVVPAPRRIRTARP